MLGLGSCSCVYGVREHSIESLFLAIPRLTLQEGSTSWLLFLDFISLLKFFIIGRFLHDRYHLYVISIFTGKIVITWALLGFHLIKK